MDIAWLSRFNAIMYNTELLHHSSLIITHLKLLLLDGIQHYSLSWNWHIHPFFRWWRAEHSRRSDSENSDNAWITLHKAIRKRNKVIWAYIFWSIYLFLFIYHSFIMHSQTLQELLVAIIYIDFIDCIKYIVQHTTTIPMLEYMITDNLRKCIVFELFIKN